MAKLNVDQRRNDDILFLGMNPSGGQEAAALRRSGARVNAVTPSREADQLEHQGRKYDLRQRRDIDEYVGTLGLRDADQRRRVADAIESGGDNARDELAGLARAWAPGERGQGVPSRLVISGHNIGAGYWGDNNGRISIDSVRKLAEAMPNAARQVEDLHLSACYSGGENGLNQWRSILPGAKTMWAYSGSAPGAWVGAQEHMQRWERATRGPVDELDPNLAQGTYKGGNVDTWSARSGLRLGASGGLAEARLRYSQTANTVAPFFSGEQKVEDTQRGPLREHYDNIQALLQRGNLPAADRPALEAERDRTIRMIYYSKTVAPRVAREHAEALRAGYSALGRAPQDFAALSRKDALREIQAVEEAARSANDPRVGRMLEVLRGLRDLDPRLIPEQWI